MKELMSRDADLLYEASNYWKSLSLDFSLKFCNLLLKELYLGTLILVLGFESIVCGFEHVEPSFESIVRRFKPIDLSFEPIDLSFEPIVLTFELIVLGLNLIDQKVFCLILLLDRDELGIQFSHFVLWLFVLQSLFLGILISFKQ